MTADPRIVATDLRRRADWLDAGDDWLHDGARFIESMVPLWDAWKAAAPSCKTCAGKGLGEPYFAGFTRGYVSRVCPACAGSPGVQPFADWCAGLPPEVTNLRAEVGDVMRREKRRRESAARWMHYLQRRIEKLKANIADEESYIVELGGKINRPIGGTR